MPVGPLWEIAAGVIGVVVGGLLVHAIKEYRARAAKGRQVDEHSHLVTKDELEAALKASLGALTKDIEGLSAAIEQATARLTDGDVCFDDFERAFRTILLTLDRLCRAWEAKFGDKLDCAALQLLIEDLHNG
ncbi:MAG: hypothetical protein K9K66_04490 [Desulfarculaceae bacterium]|nr:hypothetical protein [Desulfarculaceae bacterium]MCF8073302.1 hypothetical protein [Desulfarculaceae bacterium]MCF8100898.1 hypothetical protein [Desulfarculaceae bacterium]MCF8116646.1 hypothetical protein [Desulfarculaceae bacterium]